MASIRVWHFDGVKSMVKDHFTPSKKIHSFICLSYILKLILRNITTNLPVHFKTYLCNINLNLLVHFKIYLRNITPNV
jgi:hypothetical protein